MTHKEMTHEELVTAAVEVILHASGWEKQGIDYPFQRKAKAVAKAFLATHRTARRYAGEPNPHRRAEPAASSMTTMPNPWDNH